MRFLAGLLALLPAVAVAQPDIDTLRRQAKCVDDVAIAAVLMNACSERTEWTTAIDKVEACPTSLGALAQKRAEELILTGQISSVPGPAACVRLIEEFGDKGSRRAGLIRFLSPADIARQASERNLIRLVAITAMSPMEEACLRSAAKAVALEIRYVTDRKLSIPVPGTWQADITIDVGNGGPPDLRKFTCTVSRAPNGAFAVTAISGR